MKNDDILIGSIKFIKKKNITIMIYLTKGRKKERNTVIVQDRVLTSLRLDHENRSGLFEQAAQTYTL